MKQTKIQRSVIKSTIQLFSITCKLYGSMPGTQCDPISKHFHKMWNATAPIYQK